MKIRNFVFASVGAASLALVLSACGEPVANSNGANNKMANLTPANTSTPMNTVPANTTPGNMSNGGNHGNTTNMSNVKPANGNMNANGPKPAPTK
jgi:hypothetical protein